MKDYLRWKVKGENQTMLSKDVDVVNGMVRQKTVDDGYDTVIEAIINEVKKSGGTTISYAEAEKLYEEAVKSNMGVVEFINKRYR